jgi:hypothetical protein
MSGLAAGALDVATGSGEGFFKISGGAVGIFTLPNDGGGALVLSGIASGAPVYQLSNGMANLTISGVANGVHNKYCSAQAAFILSSSSYGLHYGGNNGNGGLLLSSKSTGHINKVATASSMFLLSSKGVGLLNKYVDCNSSQFNATRWF